MKEIVIVIVILIVVMGFIGICLSINSCTNDVCYELYRDNVKSSESWASGTYEEAKDIYTLLWSKETERSNFRINNNCIIYYNCKDTKISEFDFKYEGVALYLTEKDYHKFIVWLRRFSKPYVKNDKSLFEPIDNPPWKR